MMMRQKGSTNRMKSLDSFKHIKLSFSMFRKFFKNSLMGFKAFFNEFKNKKDI